jgi:cyclopropane fatty-acyl-phospholipid synthase-like methyltransferase
MIEMTEEQIHALPDYKTLEASMSAHYEAVDPFTSIEQFAAYVDRTVSIVAMEHFGGHRVWDLAPMAVPAPLVQMFHNAFNALWKDGFLAGARFQKLRMNELASMVIPDSLDGQL